MATRGKKCWECKLEGFSTEFASFSQNEAESRIKRAVEEGPQIFEWQSRKKNGEKLWVEVNLKYSKIGSEKKVIGVVRDITEREKTLQVLIQNEKMMSVGGLAAGMAHELNNPLGGVLQGVQNVERRLSPGLKANQEVAEEVGIDLMKLEEYLEKRDINSRLDGVRESGKKASWIVSNMLQFSRKSESKMAPVNLIELLEKTLDLAGKDYDPNKKHDFRSINVVKNFDANIPPIPCVETEIEQVILNLLNNAASAMSDKKSDESSQIELQVTNEMDMVQIVVADNGPGMSEETQKRVFEPFFTTKPVDQGTGLGLSVSYMIVTNNHGGTLKLESELEKGSKFILRLPKEAT